MESTSTLQLLRHATVIITIKNLKILVDPMLSAKAAMDPIQNCGNDIRIPMVDLPVDREKLYQMIKETDAVVITHLHRDHWDTAAQQMIDKNKFIICQPADEEKIKAQGFYNINPVTAQMEWRGITISRTGGRHGTGAIGKLMGDVSGFVFSNNGKTIYVAGDTIWCDEVADALNTYKPAYTVLNTGGAQFLTGDPITMAPRDIMNVHAHLKETKIIAVHMDTINHCFIKRTDLKQTLSQNNPAVEIIIPADGEIINLL